DREPLRPRVAVADQVLGGGAEVVEHVLLLVEHARLVPLLTVLAAAAETGRRVDAATLEPRDRLAREVRRRRGAEAAVAEQVDRVVAVELQVLAMHDEHRNPRAVLALVEDLLGREGARVERDARRPDRDEPLVSDVVAEDRSRARERAEGEPELPVVRV